jgi:two-component system sensor histidine kinase ResE
MHRLALDLLDLARFDAGIAEITLEKVNLVALLKNTAEKFFPQAAEQGVDIRLELAPLPLFSGDGDRLAQVFTNLLENALKHTVAGDTILIEAEQRGEEIRISIADTGEGIPPEALPHIFERFYQADPSRHGEESSGLGLAIVREIISAHGGKITARNAEKKGAIFTLNLPLAKQR